MIYEIYQIKGNMPVSLKEGEVTSSKGAISLEKAEVNLSKEADIHWKR